MSMTENAAIVHRRSSGPLPPRPFRVIVRPLQDDYSYDGYRYATVEYAAICVRTGVALGTGTTEASAANAARAYCAEAAEVTEAEAAALVEPRTYVASPPVRWCVVPVEGGHGVAAVNIATGAAFADSFHPAVLRAAVAKWFPFARETEVPPC